MKAPPSLAPQDMAFKGSNFSDAAKMVTSVDKSSKHDEGEQLRHLDRIDPVVKLDQGSSLNRGTGIGAEEESITKALQSIEKQIKNKIEEVREE